MFNSAAPKMTVFRILFICAIHLGLQTICCHGQTPKEGYFNGTSYINLYRPLTLTKHIGLSFRSCSGGQLFLQTTDMGPSISLEVRPDGLFFSVTMLKKYETHIKANLLDNEWHTVNILYRLGNLTLSTSGHQQVIANSTFNYDLLNLPEISPGVKTSLLVGNGFSGCILEGPSLVFNPVHMTSQNVEWGQCLLPVGPCGVVDHCFHETCMMHGSCISLPDRYHCQCTARYSGNICQIDNGPPCNRNPCRNNAECREEPNGDFTCNCLKGYIGSFCEIDLKAKLCEDTSPCLNNGTCIISNGPKHYECLCLPGFSGKNCEININECIPNPCQHGGTCLDGINYFTCLCDRTGYTGTRCDVNVDECDNNPCLNNGVCFDNYGSYTCQCSDGFLGQNCEQKLSECASSPCHFPNTICIDSGGSYQCICKPGYTGSPTNCIPSDACINKPCLNGASCISKADGFMCICPPGFTGSLCDLKIDNCKSNPCQNGGTCFDGVDIYACNCTADFMGANCELKYDACASHPCQNNGKCVPKEDKKDYYCECNPGFEGLNCESNVNDCINKWCPDNKVCVDGVNSYECLCDSPSSTNCSVDVINCKPNPCQNGGSCTESHGNYTCICPNNYKGRHCEIDVDECEDKTLCNNGICRNEIGSYQCFCKPGYSGDHCEIDFDECLSLPCQNNATCENKVNGYNCVCHPGYEGKDCSININECDPNPCVIGSTCVDGIATFSCVCPAGLTGKRCQTNIDDCESSPCLNGGVCVDGLNSYVCNCSETGYEGIHCDQNIDECQSNPCINGGKCKDMVRGFVCDCYPGYKGNNCEIDVDECALSPCQNGGLCFQKSDRNYYAPYIDSENVTNPPVFNTTFDYSTAAGYECRCVPGTTGLNCEENTNECLSSPCRNNGQCVDFINRYVCECESGYEGTHCEIEIDECERYKPCKHGMCYDKKADYVCDCETGGPIKYGGKNCSVELTGCVNNSCQNNGTCIPYLENETEHTFNCSCTNGFQGHVCEMVTTMSLNGSSYAMVNTTREEGYDIQLRFKTTLPNGLLAIGKGSTFYILELVKGRLNLRSSLLNKWEGVFIGSSLNDSNWQKVFVAINSSHLVLAANEEQTIYPINLNEGSNSSHTSFPTTYLGGTISYLRRLTNGPPSFVGCTQDAMINGQWVLPQDTGVQPISFVGVEVGCKREAQCEPNPCHSGGHCTDLWRNFSCTCERPYLGHTCQYNLTAATFGYEKINNSVVDVIVDQQARRAVRSILDISMFVRTREATGGIFYLGTHPENVQPSDQTVISTKLSGGELLLQIQFNETLESYNVGGVRLDNGFNHLIQVIRNVTLVQVKINDTEYFRKAIGATEHLDLQLLRLGNGSIPNECSVRNFKGIIQDVQVSDGSRIMVVEFFPLVAEDLKVPPKLGEVIFDHSSVLQGVVSDDTCRSEPCMHGGTCTVTWNDFSCACTVGHKGKQCQEMEFCQVQDCPSGSECRNLNHGYECVANITLHDVNETATGLKYRIVSGDISVPLNEVSVTYRSKKGGTILQIGPDEEGRFLAISFYKEQVTVSWVLGNGLGESGVHSMPIDVANVGWITVWLKMLPDNVIFGGIAKESLIKDTFSLEAWNDLVSTANITIGGSDSMFLRDSHFYITINTDQSNAIEHTQVTTTGEEIGLLGGIFQGCIGEVRIGGLLLPYFTAEELNLTNTSARDNFELIPGSTMGEQFGCMLCYDQDCQNGGACKNATESYECQCVSGYQGDDCSENIDECIENDCKNNSTCEDGLAAYRCLCQPGWEGTLCDKEIDECASNPCFNNGTCIDHFARFECRCGPDYIGLRCEQVKQITCESQPCYNNATCENIVNPKTNDNYTCTCQDGFEGDYCKSAFCEVTPCQNQGSCLSSLTKPVCDCKVGFTGKLCEIDIDECESSPCKHKGSCLDGVGKYSCNCLGTGYTGPTCEVDVDECASDSVNCGPTGDCINTVGGFYCKCEPPYCGLGCNITDPCSMSPCKNGGTCIPECMERRDYQCNCTDGFVGMNCTEKEELGSSVTDVAIIVGPIVCVILVIGFIGLTVFLMMARKKRATRGTYSPSSQEYCNPRVELDNVMKPPPEERLI